MAEALADYIALSDLAAELGVTPRSVRRWASQMSPGLTITRIGAKPFVHREDLAAWLKTRRVVRNTTNSR